jgi:hypothetical protein
VKGLLHEAKDLAPERRSTFLEHAWSGFVLTAQSGANPGSALPHSQSLHAPVSPDWVLSSVRHNGFAQESKRFLRPEYHAPQQLDGGGDVRSMTTYISASRGASSRCSRCDICVPARAIFQKDILAAPRTACSTPSGLAESFREPGVSVSFRPPSGNYQGGRERADD